MLVSVRFDPVTGRPAGESRKPAPRTGSRRRILRPVRCRVGARGADPFQARQNGDRHSALRCPRTPRGRDQRRRDGRRLVRRTDLRTGSHPDRRAVAVDLRRAALAANLRWTVRTHATGHRGLRPGKPCLSGGARTDAAIRWRLPGVIVDQAGHRDLERRRRRATTSRGSAQTATSWRFSPALRSRRKAERLDWVAWNTTATSIGRT